MKYIKTKIVVSFFLLLLVFITWTQFIRLLNGSTEEVLFALVAGLAGLIALPTAFRFIWTR